MVDHPVEDREVDVAAAEQEHDRAAGELGPALAEHSRERRGGGPLDDEFFQFQEPHHGQRERLLAHGRHAVHDSGGD